VGSEEPWARLWNEEGGGIQPDETGAVSWSDDGLSGDQDPAGMYAGVIDSHHVGAAVPDAGAPDAPPDGADGPFSSRGAFVSVAMDRLSHRTGSDGAIPPGSDGRCETEAMSHLPGSTTTPPLDDLLDRASVVSLPLATRFRGITTREAVVFDAPLRATEFSPFVEYGDAEAAVWLRAAVDFGWTEQPPALRDHVVVNATVPALPAGEVARVLARFPGCRTAKVKVAEPSQTRADDVARVAEVRRVLGPEGRIRVDANGGWNVDEAEHALRELAPFDLEYAEQPCATVAELAELRERISWMGVPIAADESVRKAEDPLAVARAGAADILVVKAQPLGGVSRALAILAETGLPVVVSRALHTSVGLAMGARLAAAIPDLEFDCGLGTAALLDADVTDAPLLPVDGRIPVRDVDLSPELLRRHAASPERTAWWRDRIARAFRLL
jgi:O-succinylbenzoate synthase